MIAVLVQDAVDDDLLGELLVVVEGSVDVAAEIAGDVEQVGLALDGGVVGAAGEVEGEPEAAQVLEQRPDARGRAARRARSCRPASAGGAGADVRFQPPQVFVLVARAARRGWPPRSRIRSASWIIW